MTTTQPTWRISANLGDANPLDYGGYFVMVDETGQYDPEAELLVPDDDDGEEKRWTVYRFVLEPCTFTDGVLSDNAYHPESPAWFADSLDRIASSVGMEHHSLTKILCSDDPIDRAQAYRAVGDYHGWENFDSDPLTFSGKAGRKELAARYKDSPR